MDASIDEKALKRKLNAPSTTPASTQTPYGPLVQTIDLGSEKLPRWEYVNPFAWLYQMSAISVGFSEIMESICVPGQQLRILMCADGLVPGNQFRPEA